MNAAVGDLRRELDDEQEPDFDVQRGLDRLAHLPCVVLDASHVVLHAFDGLDPILLIQKSRSHWRIRQKDEDGSRPGDGQRTEDEKYRLSRCSQRPHRKPLSRNTCLPRRDALDMTDTICDDTSKDTRDNIAHEPRSVSQGLLRALVPHGDDYGQPWPDRTLSRAEEETIREEASSIEAQCGQHQDGTPNEPCSQLAISFGRIARRRTQSPQSSCLQAAARSAIQRGKKQRGIRHSRCRSPTSIAIPRGGGRASAT